jgi:hypothetical protein
MLTGVIVIRQSSRAPRLTSTVLVIQGLNDADPGGLAALEPGYVLTVLMMSMRRIV